MGRALANSAASSSFASGVTGDLHVGERSGLVYAQLADLGEFEQTEERRKNLPWLGVALHELRPADVRLEREHGANDEDRAGNVERARHDFVHVGARDRTKHSVDRGKQLGERERE